METKYLHLPPLPMDLPIEQIEIIWLYAKMPEEKRKMLLEFIKENVEGRPEDIARTKYAKLMNDTDKELDSDLQEYVDYTRRFLGILISQACETAGFLYQHYCVEGKSVEEIAREYGMDEDYLRLIAQYYDKTGKKSSWEKK